MIISDKESIPPAANRRVFASEKRVERERLYDRCMLCPRKCGVDRNEGKTGYCGQKNTVKIARADLHFWEEPEISGKEGSGTVFFTGCNLGCIYCQNHTISRADTKSGRELSVSELSDVFLNLRDKGALNINLVTAVMFVPSILDALDMAKEKGLTIPVVYNSSGYESVETLKLLKGYVDIYLPDLKYLDPALSKEFSLAPDYPEVAKKAIEEMVSQTSVIVRHLVLPGHVNNSKEVLKYLYDTYGSKIKISIMSQYTPICGPFKEHAELNRRITKREYDKVVDYALSLGIENAYIQEREVAKESFIPDFDM